MQACPGYDTAELGGDLMQTLTAGCHEGWLRKGWEQYLLQCA